MKLPLKIKEEIVKRICSIISPKLIILFGSYASGKATEDSDIDLLIVEDYYNSKLEEKNKIREALKDIKIAKDILIANMDKFDFYKKEPCSVYREAYENGEVLWST